MVRLYGQTVPLHGSHNAISREVCVGYKHEKGEPEAHLFS